MREIARIVPLGMAAALLLGGCATPDGAADDDGVATYVATENQFTGPATLPAGWNTIRLRNEGQELHHLGLIKLEDGKTAADFAAYMQSGEMAEPEWVSFYGGPNATIGPLETNATVNLEAGDYLAVCFIPGSDGIPHAAKGMTMPVKVEGSSDLGEPEADVEIDLADFAFEPKQEFVAGPQTVKVSNVGEQAHELVIARLDEGKTTADLIAWLSQETLTGPPPGQPLGGLAPMEPGQSAYFDVDLGSGNYVLFCVLTDPATGKPHLAQGMVREFTIE